MLILGVLLIIAALVIFGYMLFGTMDLDPMDIDLGIFTVQLTPLHLFLLGAATLAVLALGLLALAAGMRAARRRRREVKDLRAAVRDGGGDYDRDRDRDARTAERADDRREEKSRSYDDRAADETYDDRRAERHETGSTPVVEPPRDRTVYERDVPGDHTTGDHTTGEPARKDEPGIAIPSDYSRDAPRRGDGTDPDRSGRGEGHTLSDGTPGRTDDDRNS
jgi:hypothetical protein